MGIETQWMADMEADHKAMTAMHPMGIWRRALAVCLQELMQQKGLKGADFLSAGFDAASISRYRHGLAYPRPKQIVALADVLGMRPRELSTRIRVLANCISQDPANPDFKTERERKVRVLCLTWRYVPASEVPPRVPVYRISLKK